MTCRKVPYVTRDDAQRIRSMMRHRTMQEVYRCMTCGKFHIRQKARTGAAR